MDNFTHHNHIYKNATKLNTLDVWIPNSPSPEQSSGVWVIYVHGGAWRDPLITSTAILPTLKTLSTTPSTSPKIHAYASLNYRLSPHLSHPTQPSSPSDPSRNAQHPDHINDITEALLYLETHYSISRLGYLLIGHSCGGTLVYQVPTIYEEVAVPTPICVIGSEGIYDLPSLVATHAEIPAYEEFVTSAFGANSRDWVEASPTSLAKKTVWREAWLCVLSHSEQDELVDRGQWELMEERIKRDGNGKYVFLGARGRHDEVWKGGEVLAEVIGKALELLEESKEES